MYRTNIFGFFAILLILCSQTVLAETDDGDFSCPMEVGYGSVSDGLDYYDLSAYETPLGYEHHSCSVGKCYENCIVENFKYPTWDQIADQVGSCVKDHLKNKLGPDWGDAYETFENNYDTAMDAAKAGQCAYVCATADTPREKGDCAQCVITETASKIPGAGCVVGLWSFLGDLLEPHADCLAECAAPSSTWSDDWGHACRDYGPTKDRCNGDVKETLECSDCQYVISNVKICRGGCTQVTPTGAKCEDDPCEELCNDNDDCTHDYCDEDSGQCQHIQFPNCCDPPNCDDGDKCTMDFCSDNGCRHEQIPGCCDHCEDDGDRCTSDWCDSNGVCQHTRRPGCDKPDDNFDISSLALNEINVTYNNTFEETEIAILDNGFAPFLLNILAEIGEKGELMDVSLEGVGNYSVLVVPSGGLAGLDSSDEFKSRLDEYISNGGTVIAFTQQHGYEFDALPGTFSGYGWFEDQACQYRSAGISTYHPILSGQEGFLLNLNIDGFFVNYPENATVLLTRIKNGQPAMVMYNHGKGSVIASTIYSDMAIALHQGNPEEKILIRDMIAWAKSEIKDTPGFGTDSAIVPINIPNPYSGALDGIIPDFYSGENITLIVNVTNLGEGTTENVVLALSDPDFNLQWVNVSENIGVNESRNVTINYQPLAPASGIWNILYFLYNSTDFLNAGYGGQFAYDYDLSDPNLTQFNVYVTTNNSQKETINFTNSTIEILPGKTGTINIPLDNSDIKGILGIWNSRYTVLTRENKKLYSTSQPFAISRILGNPGGYIIPGSGMQFSITSDSENYPYGSNATFTFHFWNNENQTKNITYTWGIIHHSWFGIVPAGWDDALSNYTLVPANGYVTVDYILPKVVDLDRLRAKFYANGKLLGRVDRGFFMFHPKIDIQIITEKKKYRPGENVSLLLNLSNNQSVSYNPYVYIDVTDPFNRGIFDDILNVNLSSKSFINRSFIFPLPQNSIDGIFKAKVLVFEKGKLGTNTTYFEIPKIPVTVTFDKSKYRVRDDLSLDLQINNYFNSSVNLTMEISIPDMGYLNSTFLELVGGEVRNLTYSISIPYNLSHGTHQVFITYMNSLDEFNFFIPPSKLEHDLNKMDFVPGEEISLRIENTGGVDAEFSLSHSLLDPFLNEVFSESDTNTIEAGQVKSYNHSLSNQAVNGSYFLKISYTNLETGETVNTMEILSVSGLGASLLSKTHKKVYSKGEDIAVLTNITNLDGYISGATLNLKIVSSIPEPPVPCVIPADNLIINSNTVLCPGTYNIPDTGYDGIIQINQSGVVVEGNDTIIVGSGIGYGIRNPGFEGVTIKNVMVKNFMTGIILSSTDCNYNTLLNNTVLNTRNGMVVYYGPNNTIGGNHIADSLPGSLFTKSYGLYLLYSSGNVISGNTLDSNVDYGLYMSGSIGNSLNDNSASGNTEYGFYLTNSHGNTIQGANSTGLDYNLYLDSSSSNNISECNLTGGNYGVYLGNSDSNNLENNYINTNRYGVFFLGSSESNLITGNNFNSNLFYGVYLDANYNNVTDNLFLENQRGIYLRDRDNLIVENVINDSIYTGLSFGSSEAYYNNITGNRVNGDLYYHILNENGITIEGLNLIAPKVSDIGKISIINCTDINLRNLQLDNNYEGGGSESGLFVYESSGLKMENVNASNNDFGIYLRSSSGNLVENSISEDNNEAGIYFYYSDNNIIRNGQFSSNPGTGIFISQSRNNTIENNQAGGNTEYGIYIQSSSNNTVRGNNASYNDYGIYVRSSSHSNVVSENDASYGRYGIFVYDQNNTIRGNTANSNSLDGFSLYGASTFISNNTAQSNNDDGIYVTGSTNTLTDNRADSNNGTGIHIVNSGGHTLTGNTMSGNPYNFYLEGRLNRNVANYVGDYVQNIDTSNTVDGKPMYFLVGASDEIIGGSTNAGYVGLVNCRNITVRDLILNNNSQGALLYNSSGSYIENVNSSKNYEGFLLIHSNNSNLVSSRIHDNNNAGLRLYSSGENFMEKCKANSNDLFGLRLQYSHNNTFLNNDVSETMGVAYTNANGILLYLSDFNNLTGNYVGMNEDYGIYVYVSDNNTIDNNNISYNGDSFTGYGIYFTGSKDNLIRGNNIAANDLYGIYIQSSSNNLLENNSIIHNNNQGVYSYQSNFNIYTGNNLSFNIQGIEFSSSHNNTLTNNTANSNSNGFNFGSSHDNSLSDSSMVSNRNYGVRISYSDSNHVLNNSLANNIKAGFYISTNSENNSIKNNYLTNNSIGIHIYDTGDNIIDRNDIDSSSSSGFYFQVPDSYYNTISNNRINGDRYYHIFNEDNIVLENLVLRGEKPSNLGWISIIDSLNVTVRNVILANNNATAADWYAKRSSGLYIYKSNDTLASNVTSYSNTYGIYMESGGYNAIADSNASYNNERGIYLDESHHNIIVNTTASRNFENRTGYQYGYGIYSEYSQYNTIKNCTAMQNALEPQRGTGIYFIYSDFNTLSGNTIGFHQRGIDFYDSADYNTISYNNASYNQVGIRIDGFIMSGNNNVTGNVFCNNTNIDLDAYYSTHSNYGSGNTCNTTRYWTDFGSAGGCASNCSMVGTTSALSDANFVSLSHSQESEEYLFMPRTVYVIESASLEAKNSISDLVGYSANSIENEILKIKSIEPISIIKKPIIITFSKLSRFVPWVMATEGDIVNALGKSITILANGGGSDDGFILWEESTNVDINDTLDIASQVDSLNVSGKLYLYATLESSTGQVIAYDIYPFYIIDGDLALVMETDKDIYKPGESINISGYVENLGAQKGLNLSILVNGTEIYYESFNIIQNGIHPYSTITTSIDSVTLMGIVDGVEVSHAIKVEDPLLNISNIIAPDVVGIEEFTIGLSIENQGNVTADINVKSGPESWNLAIPGKSIININRNLNILEDTTIYFNISGDMNQNLSKTIIFGEGAEINITPLSVYMEGPVEIPYSIINTGLIDSAFNVTFDIGGAGIFQEVYLPQGENLSGVAVFNLSKGLYQLRSASPFWDLNTYVNVESSPEFIFIKIPDNLVYDPGETVYINATIKNIGGMEGDVLASLESPGLIDAVNRTWIEGGQEKNVTFQILIPDDVEEKTYKLYFEADGKRNETSITINGARIGVNAILDKSYYQEGENATLYITVENLNSLDLELFSRVQWNLYSNITAFNLTGNEAWTINFTFPVHFSGDNKMLYSIYMASGRSLYINGIYIYEKPPEEAGIILHTDRQVYEIGDTVIIYVNASEGGILNLSAPGYSNQTTLLTEHLYQLNFTIPQLLSDTYYINWTYHTQNMTYTFLIPIDVDGYFARIMNLALDKKEYQSGDNFTLTALVEANRNFTGIVRLNLLGPGNNLLDLKSFNQTFLPGENSFSYRGIIWTNMSGMHSIVPNINVDLPGHSLVSIVSGARYFYGSPGVIRIDIPISQGWNMISLPVTDSNLTVPGVVLSYAYWYSPVNESYALIDINKLESRKGYWVAAINNSSITAYGYPMNTYTSGLKKGWNMIGSVNTTMGPDRITTVPADSVLPYFYWYDPLKESYNLSSSIEPGKGYWAAAVNDSMITVGN